MLIKESALEHWIKYFYGYGSWKAKIWFIAREESGGELPEEVAERIDYFQRVHATTSESVLCDIREMYKHLVFRFEGPKSNLYETHFDYRFGADAVTHGYWKNLIAFVDGYQNRETTDPAEYQKKSFASPQSGNEAWLKLFPLPGPHTHSWYYNWLDLPGMPFLKSRKIYEDTFYEGRIRQLLGQIRTHRPEVVVMYGMTNINMLKQSISEYFTGLKFRTVQATKMTIPQHHVSDLEGCTLIVTTQIPGLRHNRIETGFDWKEFGRMYNKKGLPFEGKP